MFSQAGKSYDMTRVVSPYRTKQRFRYYQLEPVKSNSRMPKLYQTLQTNLREKQDSYLLRYAKDITINTDYSPDHDLIKPTSTRQIMGKAAFQRIIGDVRNQDYSKPLMENCDHRCAEANHVAVVPDLQLQAAILSKPELPLKSQQSNEKAPIANQPLNFSKKLGMSDLKSTEHSMIKKRSSIIIEPERTEKPARKERARGVSFDSSIGHQYLREVDERDRNPECYQIQKSRESIIRRSFKQPTGHVSFGKFRDSITTRYDRADPHWMLLMDQSGKQIQQKDMSYDFDMHSPRKPNEVQSRYPFRQCMNFHIFPTLDAVLPHS